MYDLANLFHTNFIRQPVTAKNNDVHILHYEFVNDNVDMCRSSKGLQYDVFIGMTFGFFFCNVTSFDELTNQRLIAGYLLDSPLTNQIRATVSYLCEVG